TSDAIIGDLDGKTLGLFLTPEKLASHQGKEQDITFHWSLRGGQEAGGLHFELQIPPCPVASLELTLPAEAAVSVSRSVAVLTQHGSDPGQRVWRLDFTARSTVDLIIHHAEDALPTRPLIVTNVTASQRLTPERLRADFEFQVEVQHRPITRLLLDIDPLLE